MPVVTTREIAQAIKYQEQLIGTTYSRLPAINWKKDVVLLKTHDGAKYKPYPGMVEITESEYNKLSK